MVYFTMKAFVNKSSITGTFFRAPFVIQTELSSALYFQSFSDLFSQQVNMKRKVQFQFVNPSRRHCLVSN